jgi:DNA-binding transcriptional LysR family regulator
VTLTVAGADFFARVEPIFVDLEEAEQTVRATGEFRSVLRVGLSSSFAVREVAPRSLRGTAVFSAALPNTK